VVFVNNNRFDPRAPDCSGALTHNLSLPTDLTPEFLAAADRMTRHLWRPGGRWKKAGVLLLELVDECARQESFLDPIDRKRLRSLVGAMDAINEKHGRSVVRYGLGSLSRTWKPLMNRCSPRYTTRWDEMLIVK
jgi:DNA polymerase V